MTDVLYFVLAYTLIGKSQADVCKGIFQLGDVNEIKYSCQEV